MAAGAALGRLGGLAGGLGGFGRKKKPAAEQPAEQAPAKTETASAPASSGDPSGALMEMTTEMTNFSSGPVDPSKLSVPSGFKEVPNELSKMK